MADPEASPPSICAIGLACDGSLAQDDRLVIDRLDLEAWELILGLGSPGV